MAVLELKNVKKVYKMPGGGTFQALKESAPLLKRENWFRLSANPAAESQL